VGAVAAVADGSGTVSAERQEGLGHQHVVDGGGHLEVDAVEVES